MQDDTQSGILNAAIWAVFITFYLVLVTSSGQLATISRAAIILTGVMDCAVFFPIVNGGGPVLTTVASATVFREKLSFK